MAIQNRRGIYTDFDPSKLKPGEIAVVQSGDTTSSDGKAIYLCVSAGNVKRFATLDELQTYNAEAQAAASTAQSLATQIAAAQTQTANAATRAETAAGNAQALSDAIDTNYASAISNIQTTAEQAVYDSEQAISQAKQSALDVISANQTGLYQAQVETLAAIETAKDQNIAAVMAGKESALAEIQQAYEIDIARVNAKANQITQVTTEADQVAHQALAAAGNAENSVAEAMNILDTVKQNQTALTLVMEGKVDGAFVENGYLILTSNGEAVSDPIGPFAGGGGSGGGSAGNGATLSVTNTNGWLSKTIASGDNCPISLNWSSTEDGNATGKGTLKVTVNGLVKAVVDIDQGPIEYDIAKYLTAGSNIVKMTVSDIYDNSRTYNYTVTVVKLSITSSFDSSSPFSGAIMFPYVPEGQTTKLVHFILDGTEIETVSTPVSGRQLSYTIPAQSHGAHTLRVYFTADINGQSVRSNELYFEFISLQTLNMTPIIASDFNQAEVNQYATLQIGYQVYDPASLTSSVDLAVNGSTVQTITVDRSRQVWAVRADQIGTMTLTITSGGVTKTLTTVVNEVVVDIEAETEGLQLYLSSYGRNNGEANPGTWTSGSVAAEFTDFNFVSDGWQLDDDGITALRIAGDARLTIPYNIFAEDFRSTGRTIELDFATRDVRDYEGEIISCMSGNRGISLTAQEATLKSAQSSISMKYKDDEHLRISFVIQKRADHRLIFIYVDGIMSKCIMYPDTDDFSQLSPVGITIGSNDCTVDLYTVRVYDHDLTRQQVLNNWIMDTQDGVLMLERYNRNNIYDAYGQIVVDKLPKNLPYMVMTGERLSETKTDTQYVDEVFTDPTNSAKSFTSPQTKQKVQGTSSASYWRKNFKSDHVQGFIMISGTSPKYTLKALTVPVKLFCYKADVASSEGANNTVGVQIFCDLAPFQIPEQVENPSVRLGIDGFPMVLMWNNGTTTRFWGKYNFNLDKSTEEAYGFAEGDESWEELNNTSDNCLYKAWNSSWQNDFEARYPDGSTDVTRLSEMVSWVASTKNDLDKFINEFDQYFDKIASIYYYVFIHWGGFVDNGAKNAFPTYKASMGKWIWLPYDFDTCLGTNNEGQLVFDYAIEFGDQLDENAYVYNAAESVFWKNLELAFPDEIKAMYTQLRSNSLFSYQGIKGRFDEHQNKWPEAIFNEDAQTKYLEPLEVNNDAGYLTMLQGAKKSQRDWWLFHRFKYFDSKYNCADNLTSAITVRGYAKADLTVTPYTDLYVNVKYGSYLESTRGKAGVAYTMPCNLDTVNDTETYIYGADQIKNVDGLPAYQVGYANFAAATKLHEIILGSAAPGYQNQRLTELHLGDLKLLKKIDCRNCVNLGTGTTAVVDASGCSNIEEIYMDSTRITGIDLPNGGQLRVLHLPSTITNLTIKNQKKITDLTVPSFANVSTLVLENVSSVIDPLSLLDQIAANARLRLVGFDLGTITSTQLKAFMDKLDTFRGLDDSGNTVATAQVSGTCHIASVTGEDMAEFQARYPYITVTYDHLTAYVYYYTEDGSSLLYTETVQDGGNATWTGTSSKASTAQYNYTFDGWSSTPGGSKWAAAQTAVSANRNLYAHFSASLRYYTVYFYNGSTLLATVPNVPYGGSASYPGSTSSITNGSGDPFTGWNPLPTNIQGNTSCYAQFVPMYTCTFKNGSETLYTVRVRQGSNVTYAGPDLTGVTDSNGNPWIGWDKALTNIQSNTTFNAVFYDFGETITDSWETIISNINGASNGASCGYSVGDIKVVDFGGDCGKLGMQLVAVDMDNLADGSGKAKTTWLAKEIGRTDHRMNPALVQETEERVTGTMWIESDGVYSSKNQRKSNSSASAVWTITASTAGTLVVSHKVSSEQNYDKLTVKNGSQIIVNDVSGAIDWTDTTIDVTAGQTVTITATYSKDSSSDSGEDTAWIKFGGTAERSIVFTPDNIIEQVPTGVYIEGTGTIGGWEHSEMRIYVKSLKANLPSALQTGIKNVTKTTTAYNTSGTSYTESVTDDLWIPDYNELFNSSAAVKYTGFFTDNNSRKKYKVGATSSYYWWGRYAGSTTYFRYVTGNGNDGNYYAYYSYGVVPGFCI